jgi:hypothetical protein
MLWTIANPKAGLDSRAEPFRRGRAIFTLREIEPLRRMGVGKWP